MSEVMRQPRRPVVAHNVGSMTPIYTGEPDSELEINSKPAGDIVTDERCSVCNWPEVCEADHTCWEENKRRRVAAEAERRNGRRVEYEDTTINGRRPNIATDLAEIDVDGLSPESDDDEPDPMVEPYDQPEPEPAPPEVEAAPVKRGRGRRPGFGKWNPDTITAAIQAWAAEHGRPPTSNDKDPALPVISTVATHCGSWSNAIEAAGFPRPKRGGDRVPVAAPDPPPTPVEVDEPTPVAAVAVAVATKPANSPRPVVNGRTTLVELAAALEELDAQIARLRIVRAEVADSMRRRIDGPELAVISPEKGGI